MKTIKAYKEDGDTAEDLAKQVAIAAAFNGGRFIYVNDDNPERIEISDYEKVLAVVVQA